jgi:hypothetical protein
MPPPSRRETIALAASLLVFLFFSTAWIRLPGPQQDELLHYPVISRTPGQPIEFAVKIHHHSYPLMIMSYVGALKGWLLKAWFLAVPRGVAGYRALGILLGLLTIWLIFRLARRYYGPGVAVLATILAATDPSIIHTTRLDFGPVAMMQFLKMSALALLSRWLDGGSPRALAGSLFVFGLALWDKANFIWFLAGFVITLLVLYPRETLARLRADRRAASFATAAFLLGAAPFLAYNLTHSAQTLRERGRFEIRWSKVLEAQAAFTGTFMQGMTGEDQLEAAPPAHHLPFPGLANWMYDLGRKRQTIQLPLLGLALLALPLNLWITTSRRRLLFPLVVSLATYACMFFTFQGGASTHHVIMVQPFAILFLAASLWTPAERWPGPWPSNVPRVVAAAACAAAIVFNISVTARHLAIYTRTGGASSGFSDAVYKLVPYLAQHPGRKIYAMDWGFSNPVMFLGEPWNLKVDEIIFSFSEPNGSGRTGETERLAALMRDPSNLFLLHSPQRTFFPEPNRQFFTLADGGIEMRQAAFFEERSGEIAYEVYEHGRPAPGQVIRPEVTIEFLPPRIAPGQEYIIRVPELANGWIDLVYHVDQAASGTVTRFCRLDADGRATMRVPLTHPLATVEVTFIRRSGGEWRRARGAITVVKQP